MEHIFTNTIKEILNKRFLEKADDIFEKSLLIQYINIKTKSADKGSKSRSSFANLYAIYVLLEDYIQHDYHERNDYSKYEGAAFSKLFHRQRELPFGSKLQNHALNNRVISEFQKYFPYSEQIPILRNLDTNRYWINEKLIKININDITINLAASIIEIIDAYIDSKQKSFRAFIGYCNNLKGIDVKTTKELTDFILGLLSKNTDSRIFEIVSYSILKYYYSDTIIYWGFDLQKIKKDFLHLYKTGRTNANDGGIDFIMKPLGRIFQVTETLDVKKYFLDIEKIERYPITFIVKSDNSIEEIKEKLIINAISWYAIDAIVDKYMSCIEEIINIPELTDRLVYAIQNGYVTKILEEIITQSKVEFNF